MKNCMTAKEELELLDRLYVVDSPVDTQRNIAERIKLLVDFERLDECPKGLDHSWDTFSPDGQIHNGPCEAICGKCGFRPTLEQNESLFYDKPE